MIAQSQIGDIHCFVIHSGDNPVTPAATTAAEQNVIRSVFRNLKRIDVRLSALFHADRFSAIRLRSHERCKRRFSVRFSGIQIMNERLRSCRTRRLTELRFPVNRYRTRKTVVETDQKRSAVNPSFRHFLRTDLYRKFHPVSGTEFSG